MLSFNPIKQLQQHIPFPGSYRYAGTVNHHHPAAISFVEVAYFVDVEDVRLVDAVKAVLQQ